MLFRSEKHIKGLAKLLQDIPPARLFDETLKLYLSGKAVETHQLLVEYGIFGHLFTDSARLLASEPESTAAKLLTRALENTDTRIKEGKPVTPAFLFAAILWGPTFARWQNYQDKKIPPLPALQKAANELISKQVQRVAFPKRLTLVARDIWLLQIRLTMRQGKRAFRLLTHPKFRAAYDFLLIREAAAKENSNLGDWWTKFQKQNEDERNSVINKLKVERENESDKKFGFWSELI